MWGYVLVPRAGEPAAGRQLLHRYLDGPGFVAVAKTLYDPGDPLWEAYGRGFGIADLDAPSHATVLPLYPLCIRLLSPVFGYFDAMLVATLLLSTAAVLVFHSVLEDLSLVANPFWTSLVFILFPARWLLYHSVGANEAAFVLLVLLTFWAYRKDRLFLAALLGGLAALTRIHGVLLYPALLLAETRRHAARGSFTWGPFFPALRMAALMRSAFLLLPIPALLFAQFLVYRARLGDFFAYFVANERNWSWVPFHGIYRNVAAAPAVSYGIALLLPALVYGLVWHWRRGNHDVAFLCGLLMIPSLFTTLDDIARYLIPVYPFLLFQPFDRLWSRREARWAFAALIPVTYAYVWAALPTNLLNPILYESLRQHLATLGR